MWWLLLLALPAKKWWSASARKNPLVVDAVGMAEDRDMVKANVLLHRPHQLAPSARRAAPIRVSPRMAQVHRMAAHPAPKAPAVAAQSAAHATQHLLACPTTILITNPQHITKKMIFNRVPMRIWAPKVGSMLLAINRGAAQAVNPTPPWLRSIYSAATTVVAVVAANAALAEAVVVVVAVNPAAVTQAKKRAVAASVAEKALRA